MRDEFEKKGRGGMDVLICIFVIIFPKCHFDASYSDKEPSLPLLLHFCLLSFITLLAFPSASPTLAHLPLPKSYIYYFSLKYHFHSTFIFSLNTLLFSKYKKIN